jgi:hypothetical protein
MHIIVTFGSTFCNKIKYDYNINIRGKVMGMRPKMSFLKLHHWNKKKWIASKWCVINRPTKYFGQEFTIKWKDHQEKIKYC